MDVGVTSHSNDDIGNYYHSASATADNIVRGRYGSRNPATGKVDEVVYTAGPRGFRANGANIHRKMDLAQFPVRPRGSPDDPLADTYDDPSYSFSYGSDDQSRSENSDSTGRVRGLYSFLDDEGERHNVRYAAGAGTGFEVLNSIPDNPASVAYAAPLYKARPKTRGKMTTQRGPNGTYKLIAAGPDHRRAETRSPDGFVKGTYSYLDDTGVQRTVEYIAGPGIGYRIVKNRIGAGSHINPSITEFRLSDTNFKLANDFSIDSNINNVRGESEPNDDIRGGSRVGDVDYLKKTGGMGTKKSNSEKASNNDNSQENTAMKDDTNNRAKTDRMGSASRNRGTTRYGYNSDSGSAKDRVRPNVNRNNNRHRNQGTSSYTSKYNKPIGSSRHGGAGGADGAGGAGSTGGYKYDSPAIYSDSLDFNDDDLGSLPPLISSNNGILKLDRDRDWIYGNRDSTVIKNVGKWYVGLPPGHSVRAHVENIDILPLGGRRVPSPSEALRQDEITDILTSNESGMSYNR